MTAKEYCKNKFNVSLPISTISALTGVGRRQVYRLFDRPDKGEFDSVVRIAIKAQYDNLCKVVDK